MHHPEICQIMLVIEDYFLLVDNNDPTYQIEPVTNKVGDSINSIGIVIKRKLLNGYVYIEIKGDNRDDNTVKISYSLTDNNNEYLKSIGINSYGYTIDQIRDAMRTIFILDKDPIKDEAIPIAA
jgi:hypothetical protein